MGEMLCLEQIEAGLGSIKLHDLQFDPQKINEKLVGSPVLVKHMHILHATISIPLINWNENCKLKLEDLELVLEVNNNVNIGDAKTDVELLASIVNGADSIFEDGLKKMISEEEDNSKRSKKVLIQFLEQLFFGAEVEIINAAIRLEARDEQQASMQHKRAGLAVLCPRFYYHNPPSTSTEPTELHKVVTITGLRIGLWDLSAHGQGDSVSASSMLTEAAVRQRLTTLFTTSHDIQCDVKLQIEKKFQPRSREEVTSRDNKSSVTNERKTIKRVDLQCDVNEVHCCLNPKQMHRVLELLTAVTASTASSASATPSHSRNIAGTARKQTRNNMHLSASPNDKYMFQSYVPDYVDNSDDEYTSFSEGEEDDEDDDMDQVWFKAAEDIANNNNGHRDNHANQMSEDGAEDDDTVIISAQLIKSRFPDDIDEFKDVDDDELNDVMGSSADKLMIDKAKIDWSVRLNMQCISVSLLYDSYHSPKVLNTLNVHAAHHALTHDHLHMLVQQFNIHVDHTGSNRAIDLHIGDISVTEHFFKVQHNVVESDIHSSRSSEFTDVLHDEDLNSEPTDNHIVRHLLRVESPLEGPNTLQRSHHGPALVLNISTTRGLQSVKAQLAPFRLEIDVDLPNRLDNWLHALEGWSKERAVKSAPSPATPAQRINSRPSSYKSTSGSFKSAPRSWSSTSNKSEELSDRAEELMNELKISGEFLRIVIKFPHREEKHESSVNSQFRRDARTRREALVLELINPQVRCHSIVNHPSVQYHFHFDQLTAYLARNHEDKMTGWRQILEIHQLSSSSEATEPVTLTLLSAASNAPAHPAKPREGDNKEPWQQWRQHYDGPFQSVMTVTEGLILNSKTETMDPVPVLLPVDELIAWKGSTMESCRLVLTLTFPHVTVDLARSDYALLMELIESLLLSVQQYSNSVAVTREESPAIASAVDSLSTAAVMLHIKSGEVVLHHESEGPHEPSYSYGLEVDGVQLFTVSGYKGSTKGYMTFAMDTLTAVDNRRDRELLAYKSQRSGLKLKGRDVLSITSASDTRANQQLHSVMLINIAELLLKQTDFTWLTNLTHYVTRPSLLPEVASADQLFVTLDDVTWQIIHPNKCAGVLTAQSLKLAHRTSRPATPAQNASYAALANHLTLFVLANTDHAKPVPYHTIFSTREEDTQLSYQQRVHEYWRTCGYVPVAHQDFTELSATSQSKGPGFQLKVSNNQLTVDTCVDSFKALQTFISSLLADTSVASGPSPNSSPIEVQTGPNNNNLSESASDVNVHTPSSQSLLGDSVREDYVEDEKQDEGYVIFALDESDVITPVTQPLTSVPLLHSQSMGSVSRRDSDVKSVAQNKNNVAPRSEGAVQWLSEDQQLVLVPDYLDQISRDEEDFVFKLPAHYPNPISSISLIDIKVCWNLHSGHDWGRLAKRGPALMQLSLDKLTFQQLYFAVDANAPLTDDTEHPAWRINLAVHDVVVYDLHPSSSWNKFLCHNVKIARPHFNAPMLSTVLQARQRTPTSLAYHWKLSILPLRLNIDQDTLGFLNEYFTEVLDSQHVTESAALSDEELPWIESVEVLPIRALVDVKVKEVSQVRSQALSVLSTENAQLDIKRIRISDVRGWSAVMHAVASEATRQLLRQAPGQYLAGLRGLPHYLSHLSSAVSGLVLVPWQEYSKSGNVSQGFVKAWTNFARELTVGSADLAGRAMVDASALLDRLLGDSSEPHSAQSAVPGDKRPSKYAGLPSNTTEGLQGAWESMTRELKTAKDRLFVVPMREYKQRGTQGLLRSVVKGVPVAIVKPLIGTTEGLGKVFLGVRNSIDKNQKLDSDNKYGTK